MNTQRFWNCLLVDRRQMARRRVEVYGVEIAAGARYLRKIRNLSEHGLMLEDRLRLKRPGMILELELPRKEQAPLRVRAVVVRAAGNGDIGVRTLDAAPLDGVAGFVDL